MLFLFLPLLFAMYLQVLPLLLLYFDFLLYLKDLLPFLLFCYLPILRLLFCICLLYILLYRSLLFPLLPYIHRLLLFCRLLPILSGFYLFRPVYISQYYIHFELLHKYLFELLYFLRLYLLHLPFPLLLLCFRHLLYLKPLR